jgi:hypothetical protein
LEVILKLQAMLGVGNSAGVAGRRRHAFDHSVLVSGWSRGVTSFISFFKFHSKCSYVVTLL